MSQDTGAVRTFRLGKGDFSRVGFGLDGKSEEPVNGEVRADWVDFWRGSTNADIWPQGAVLELELKEMAGFVGIWINGQVWGAVVVENGVSLPEGLPKDLRYLGVDKAGELVDLGPLSKMKGLISLDLSGCMSLTDISPLAGLSGLTVLDLGSSDSLTDLSPLAGLSGLISLDLSYCASLEDLSPLAGLNGLTSLGLARIESPADGYWCESLFDLSPLKGLIRLTSLNLNGWETLEDLSPLAVLSELTSLDLGNCNSLTDFSPLAGLLRLTSLDHSRYELPDKMMDFLTDLSSLAGLSRLTSLDLGIGDEYINIWGKHNETLTDLSPLAGLSELTSLCLCNCYSLTDLSPLAGLSRLTSLNLSGCSALTDLSPLAGLSRLTSLHLGDCPPLADPKRWISLRNCPNLRRLSSKRPMDVAYVMAFHPQRVKEPSYIQEHWDEWCYALKVVPKGYEDATYELLEELIRQVPFAVKHHSQAREDLLSAMSQCTVVLDRHIQHYLQSASTEPNSLYSGLTWCMQSNKPLFHVGLFEWLRKHPEHKCAIPELAEEVDQRQQAWLKLKGDPYLVAPTMVLWADDLQKPSWKEPWLSHGSIPTEWDAEQCLRLFNLQHKPNQRQPTVSISASLGASAASGDLTNKIQNLPWFGALGEVELQAIPCYETDLVQMGLADLDDSLRKAGLECRETVLKTELQAPAVEQIVKSQKAVTAQMVRQEACTEKGLVHKNVQKIIKKAKETGDLKPLANLTELTELDLESCKSLTDLRPLAGLNGLTSLNLQYCDFLTDLSPLAGLSGLNSLNLGSCKSLTDLSPLAGLTGLTSLKLSSCSALTDLSPLAGLSELTELMLWWCNSLTDLSPLSTLSSICSIYISHCPNLLDLSPLMHCLHLAKLDSDLPLQAHRLLAHTASCRGDHDALAKILSELSDEYPSCDTPILLALLQTCAHSASILSEPAISSLSFMLKDLPDLPPSAANLVTTFCQNLRPHPALPEIYDDLLQANSQAIRAGAIESLAREKPELRKAHAASIEAHLAQALRESEQVAIFAPAACCWFEAQGNEEHRQRWHKRASNLDATLGHQCSAALSTYALSFGREKASRALLNKIDDPTLLHHSLEVHTRMLVRIDPVKAMETVAEIADIGHRDGLLRELMHGPLVDNEKALSWLVILWQSDMERMADLMATLLNANHPSGHVFKAAYLPPAKLDARFILERPFWQKHLSTEQRAALRPRLAEPEFVQALFELGVLRFLEEEEEITSKKVRAIRGFLPNFELPFVTKA